MPRHQLRLGPSASASVARIIQLCTTPHDATTCIYSAHGATDPRNCTACPAFNGNFERDPCFSLLLLARNTNLGAYLGSPGRIRSIVLMNFIILVLSGLSNCSISPHYSPSWLKFCFVCEQMLVEPVEPVESPRGESKNKLRRTRRLSANNNKTRCIKKNSAQ